eukprot:g5003.t1
MIMPLGSQNLSKKELEEDLQASLDAATHAPSIYLIIWANRSKLWDLNWVYLFLTVTAQLLIPLAMVGENFPARDGMSLSDGFCPRKAKPFIKISGFILLFMGIAFSESVNDEILAFSYLERVKDHGKYRLVLKLGEVVQRVCFTTCVLATYILFLQNTTIVSLLLNCVGLFFILEADNTIVGGRKKDKMKAIRHLKQIVDDGEIKYGATRQRWIQETLRKQSSICSRFSPRPNVCEKPSWVIRYMINTILRIFWVLCGVAKFLILVTAPVCL